MHVVHLTWEYPPLVYGGLGRHVHALARAQAVAGDQVTVVTQQSGDAPTEEILDGVRVVRVAPDSPFPYHLPSMLTWVGGLDHVIGTAASALSAADVVHAHDWVVGRAGSTTAAALDAPLIATIHATEAGRHQGWLPDPVARAVHLVEQWLVDEADEIIVCSSAMAGEVIRGHGAQPRRVTVIPNGIDADAFERTTHIREGLLAGDPRLTFVGRIEWEKGVLVAVAAMPEILNRHPQARLRIVGTGNQIEAVESLIAELGVAEHVDLLGHVSEEILREVYSSTDLVIIPSSYEPFGLVALEAAAMGVPLVVGDTGGLAEFVTDERGRRHRPDDPDDLARTVLQALADPVATASRRDEALAALQRYSWPVIASSTDDVYRRAVRHPDPRRVLRAPDGRLWD